MAGHEHQSLTFLGGTGTVTGSKFLLEGGGHRLLLDCGLFQGERQWRRKNWEAFPVPPDTIDDVVLTHCHLDHCGYLPALVREGFDGPVWMTEGSRELIEIVLRDAAHLQERDAQDARSGGWSRHDPPLPLYTVADAERSFALFRGRPFDTDTEIRPGTTVRLTRAGHVLGAASVSVSTGAARVLFSGDLGRPTHPVLRPRGTPPGARTVVVESTYGDRVHPAGTGHAVLADAIRRTVGRGGTVLIPAFAVDRTELVLNALSDLTRRGLIPRVPVFVDSPMALAALDVYRRAAARGELREDVGPDLVDLPALHTAATPEESMALDTAVMPCVIVSASGMASGGRVVHHLRHLLPDRRSCVVLTGYQAVGTRGRALLDGAHELKMHGRYVPVRAEVVLDEEFSVHADAGELVAWLRDLPEEPETVYVVHGEAAASRALAGRIREELDWTVAVPRPGERVRVD
ncbi:MBL fold metallo-hydrolase [Georgenia muralis]